DRDDHENTDGDRWAKPALNERPEQRDQREPTSNQPDPRLACTPVEHRTLREPADRCLYQSDRRHKTCDVSDVPNLCPKADALGNNDLAILLEQVTRNGVSVPRLEKRSQHRLRPYWRMHVVRRYW